MLPIYKFIGNPADTVFLLEGRLKFTPIHELNDPSELVPYVDTILVADSLRRLRSNGYAAEDIEFLKRQALVLERLAPEFMVAPPPQTATEATRRIRHPAYDDLPRLTSYIEELAAKMSDRVGVLCLTQREDALPMWAHYAANAAGLLVEFRGLEEVFSGDSTRMLGQPLPVRYTRGQEAMTFDPRTHDTLFFTKFEDWSYEREVRVVLPLVDCQRIDTRGRTLFLKEVGRGRVARLLLGWRMTDEAVEMVRTFVREIDPRVEVVRMEVAGGKVIRGRVL